MAKAIEIVEDWGDDEPKQQAVVGTESQRRAADLLSQMAGTGEIGDGYINISSVDGATEARCLKVSADKYLYDDLIEKVRADFGAGDYRFRLYLKHASGRYVLAENRLETIREARAASPVVAPQALTVNAMPDANADLLRELVQRQQDQFDQLMARQRENVQERPDMLATLERVAVIATPFIPMLAGLVSRRSNGIGELKSLLELTGTVKELREGAPLELPDNSPPWVALVQQGLQMLPALVAGMPRQSNPLPALPHAQEGAAPLSLPPPALPSVSDLPDVSLFAPQMPAILALADALPPDQAAQRIYDLLPIESRGAVHQQLLHERFLSAIMRHCPDVVDRLDWLMYMREALLDLLDATNELSRTTQNSGAGDTGRDSGHSGDLDGNATVDHGVSSPP